MANVRPFRGVRYNPSRFDNLSNVVSQPYDRVRYGLQEKYYGLNEYNVVRLVKNKEQPGDDATDNVYTRARDLYGQWLDQGVLMRDERPALYAYRQTFTTPDGSTLTRRAFIGALQLTTFDEDIVLPHERTHAGPKADRLNLLRATGVNFGLIFMVYPDPSNRVNAILDEAVARQQPAIDVTELLEKDVRQQVWVVSDPEVIGAVQAEMAPKTNLIIADGHHRYETAINYRDEMRSRHPDAPPNAAFNFRMVTLVSMDDPGLVILPTHREITDKEAATTSELLERAAEYFIITPVADLQACLSLMSENETRHAFGFYAGGPFYVLVLKDASLLDQLIPGDRALAWKSLDVTILHSILLEQVGGVSGEAIDAQENVRYHREPDPAITAVDAGDADFVFLLNPTRMEQVKACTRAGEKMPQKSTDFYPKAISGLVMCPVGSEERLE